MKLEEFRQLAADAIGYKGSVTDQKAFNEALLAYQNAHHAEFTKLCNEWVAKGYHKEDEQ
jgi:hypothetical protein